MKGTLLLLLTALLWGTGLISQKLGNEAMPPMTFNAIRQIMAGIVMTPIAVRGMHMSGYLSRERNSISQLSYRKRKLAAAGFLCGFFLLFGTATQQIGLISVSAGKSGFISSLYIVLVPLFSIIVGSKVSGRSVVCVAVAVAGFAIMSLSEGLGGATLGDWLTLLSAAGFAAQIVAVNQFLDKDNALIISCLQFFVCGVMGMIIALIAEQPTLTDIVSGIPVLLYQTIVPTAGGYTFQILGQRHTESSYAALLMSTEAVFAAIFGVLILNESMSGREILGAVIISAAIILGQIKRKK